MAAEKCVAHGEGVSWARLEARISGEVKRTSCQHRNPPCPEGLCLSATGCGRGRVLSPLAWTSLLCLEAPVSEPGEGEFPRAYLFVVEFVPQR